MADANSTSSRTSERNVGSSQSGETALPRTSAIQPAPENPYLRNLTCVPHELTHLLLKLPSSESKINTSDKDMNLMAEATVTHAESAQTTLTFGLQAIGSLMFVAGTNDEYALEEGELADLGCLIRHLANEVHAMIEIQRKFDQVGKGGAA